MITASELLGEVRPPKLRGTPRVVRRPLDVDRLPWRPPVPVPPPVVVEAAPVAKPKPKATTKRKPKRKVRLSPADWLALQRANAANMHAIMRARRAEEAPARRAREARIAEVGAYIKSRRIALNLSQHDVAMLTGYPTRAQVGAFELGREALPAKRVASMAAALQCDPERLRVPPLSEFLA